MKKVSKKAKKGESFDDVEKRQKLIEKQQDANKFDRILKENAPDSIDRIIEIATNLRMIQWEDYPHEVQYTLERRPDFLKKVVEQDGTPAIWHGEYQVPDDKKMVFRFLVYCGLFKRNEGNILVRQFVIYLGENPPEMQTEITDPDLFFRFSLIPLILIPYEKLMESGKPAEAILAMLCDLQGKPPEQVLQKVVQAIVQNSDSDLEKQKHLQQLQIMGQLRNFVEIIENVMESESLKEYVSIEKTYFYKKGMEAATTAAEAKYQKLEQERKDIELRLLQEHELFIASLLLNDSFKKEKIATFASATMEVIENVEAKILKIQKLLSGQMLNVEEIAYVAKVTPAFVQIVADASNIDVTN
jgi:uncharacterized protein (DUF2164 family)